MSNPVSRFFGFFVHLKAKVSDFFIHLFGPQTASELAHAAISVLTQTEIGKEIYQYVEDFNAPTFAAITGDVKRLQVISKAQAWAAAKGITVPESVISLLVEFAVTKLKGYYTEAGAHEASNPPSTPPSEAPVPSA